MALDERYIPDISLSEYLVDPETGEPITGGTVSFFQDEARSIPKLVFELSGSPPNYTYTALPNPMDVSIGRPVNNTGDNVAIYYYPYDDLGNIQNYYIVVKNADGVVTEEREAWPNLTGADDPTRTENSIVNALSNSQFVDVLFNPDYGVTITTDGAVSNATYDIAPDWFLEISSNDTATVTVDRTALPGSLDIITNPPYRLDLLMSGANITSIKLVQRLYNNPDIWAAGFIAGSLVATSLDNVSRTIEMLYAPSIAPASNTIFTDVTGTTGYVRMDATIELDDGQNTDAPPDGYVDIEIVLPVSGHVGITSVQVVGLNTNQEDVLYDQEPVNRQKDHLAHYYLSLVQAVPVPSLSVGWDFRVNPAQFGATQGASTLASRYIWDQTIVWQGASNLITAQRSSNQSRLRIILTGTGQFALVQYLDSHEMRQLLTNQFSMIIDAYTNIVGGVAGTASVWVTSDATLPDITSPAGLSLIATLDANGKPATFNGNWTEVPRNYRGDARFTIPYSADNLSTKTALEGWNRVDNTILTDATFCAIVIGFASSVAGDLAFESISVTPGPLAVPFAPMSYDQTLYNLQRYYEKSYGENVGIGALTTRNALSYLMQGKWTSNYDAHLGVFYIAWRAPKRMQDGVVTLYSPTTGDADNVRYLVISGNTDLYDANEAISNWAVTTGVNSNIYSPNISTSIYSESAAAHGATQSLIQFHYTNDCRLGVV